MRRLFALGLMLALVSGCAGPPSLNSRHWDNYHSRFILPEGRVVDTGNSDVSHSEGQGIAMLLAVAFDDRARFDQMWRWTQSHLQIRDDHLFAWRWIPSEGVTDKNNASDGDILIAWALYRAAARWQQPPYRTAADAITADIRTTLLRPSRHGVLLLPGAEGFVNDEGVVVNLSYWVFPAFREFAAVSHAAEWAALEKTGMKLLGIARYGRWQLPPDWLQVGEKLSLPAAFSPRFSYDAIRIPLYMTWSGVDDNALYQPYMDFWGYFAGAQFVPAWTDLQDDSVDSYDASPGFHALIKLVAESAGASYVPVRVTTPSVKEDYYSASLGMLSHLVQFERSPR